MFDIKKGWSLYLDQQDKAGRLCARYLWNMLADTNVNIPGAWPTKENGIFFYWDDDQHRLDIVISPDNIIEWVYRNRKTDYYDGKDSLTEIDDQLKELLKLFANKD